RSTSGVRSRRRSCTDRRTVAGKSPRERRRAASPFRRTLLAVVVGEPCVLSTERAPPRRGGVSMLVSNWMTARRGTVAPTTGIADAALTMSRRRIRRLLVTEATPRGETLRGIVSLKDLARAFPPDVNPLSLGAESGGAVPKGSGRTVGEIMAKNPRTVAP